jgi:hypothetical protein
MRILFLVKISHRFKVPCADFERVSQIISDIFPLFGCSQLFERDLLQWTANVGIPKTVYVVTGFYPSGHKKVLQIVSARRVASFDADQRFQIQLACEGRQDECWVN